MKNGEKRGEKERGMIEQAGNDRKQEVRFKGITRKLEVRVTKKKK
jgi:hypothetical protein